MSGTIQILPEQLCNQIAAGEVVERPASVVKELLENALDAGATEITVEVEKGGRRLIRVVDNGHGMGRDDAFLCLERHATSKIRAADDLFALRTLGFRGEALPAIASVSRMLLRTHAAGEESGWEIYAEGGVIRRANAFGMPPGTTLEIRDLFFNTPARRKFLRKEQTELGHIADLVTRLALASPQVRFRLVHDGKTLVDAYRQSRLAERVGALLGRPLLAELLELGVDDGQGMRLSGFISQPAVQRATTGALHLYINHRYVRDRVVRHALLEGYRHVLPRGRYPVVVLFLELDPGQVDVNVHPTKDEVRFRDQRQVHDFIAAAVRRTLKSSSWLPDPQTPVEDAPTASGSDIDDVPRPAAPSRDLRQAVQESLDNYARTHFPPLQPPVSAPTFVAGPLPAPVAPLPMTPAAKTGFFSSLRLIGQYRNCYLVCQDGQDLILIDQHAAHERIGFERLRQQYRQGDIPSQSLLFPVVIEVDFGEAEALREALPHLERLGLIVEPFGGKSYVLKEIPQLLDAGQAEQLLRDLAAELRQIGRSTLAEDALEQVLILMACHGVIRANQALSPAQMTALLRDLDRVDFGAQCPHGRPVMVRQRFAEIEKLFKRS
jgi:DNA mismatch repair protein MutL